MKPELPRLVISLGLLLLFAFAYVRNPSDQLLIGALINMAGTAMQYWLGSSKGASDSNARADKALDLAKTAQEQAK
jgi:ABC-type uncharacterized transport system permease subunit